MNKTIWYITKYFSPQTKTSPGGRSWFLMYELAQKGYKPIVITSDSNNLVELPLLDEPVKIQNVDGVTLIWLKTIKYSVAKSIMRVVSWLHFEWNVFKLNKRGIDKPSVIVISSLSLLTIVNGLWLKHKYKCSLVLEVRDIWPLTIIEEGGFSKHNPLVKCLSLIERIGYVKADAIIGTMPNLSSHIYKTIGVNKSVHCIPMGVAQEHLNGEALLPLGYYQKYLNSNKFKIVHAGTIGITNALDTFFQAALVLENNNEIEFILVGDGALKQYYIEKYGMLTNVIFAPKVARNQVQSVLKECDLVYFSVHNSRVWDYGQSLNKIVDYMLSGKPIVASYSGYPSMINEADCGSFVPAEDVDSLVIEFIKYSLLEPSVVGAIGKRGRDWILTNRSYTKLAEEFSEVVFNV